MPTPCPEITLYNPCYPRGYLQEKEKEKHDKQECEICWAIPESMNTSRNVLE